MRALQLLPRRGKVRIRQVPMTSISEVTHSISQVDIVQEATPLLSSEKLPSRPSNQVSSRGTTFRISSVSRQPSEALLLVQCSWAAWAAFWVEPLVPWLAAPFPSRARRHANANERGGEAVAASYAVAGSPWAARLEEQLVEQLAWHWGPLLGQPLEPSLAAPLRQRSLQAGTKTMEEDMPPHLLRKGHGRAHRRAQAENTPIWFRTWSGGSS